MGNSYRKLLWLGSLGLFVAAAACSHDGMLTGSAGAVPTTVTLRTGSAALASAIGMLADEGDSGRGDSARGDDGRGDFFGRISKADIDSLTVDITKVEVKAALPDSENAADSAAEAPKDTAKAGDDDDEGKEQDENDERTWVSLDVTGGGHLNLLKLPDSASAGIQIATGLLTPGVYKHVRLFAKNAMIFLKNQIVTPTGDTLKAGVGIPVIIPSADSTGAIIKTDERFTVPNGGGTVSLFFDADDTIRHVVITGDGKVIVPPVIR